jgi:hypothetical protein
MEEMNAERLTGAELMEAVVRRDSDAIAAIYEPTNRCYAR